MLVNHDPAEDYEVSRGDRIAQLVIVAAWPGGPSSPWGPEGLGTSERGAGGFGHFTGIVTGGGAERAKEVTWRGRLAGKKGR